MCGIAGFIGNSTNQKATFDLINQLMIKTESRGEHATGFWSTLGNDDKRVLYHKEPIKSTAFVKHELWRGLEEQSPSLLLGHCRWTSPGGGPEKINKNNHPHVSKDCRVALVHNGKIPEYNHLKKKYTINSDCDSEVLLRIFESGEDYHDQAAFLRKEMPKVWEDTPDSLLYRIYGLRKIFSEVSYGAMAVAIGERLDNNARSLFLFRNEHRPMVLIDLRETLGQIFFCSTPEIFRQAYDASEIAKTVIPEDQGVITLPEDWIYSFVLDHEGEFQLRRLKINRTRKYGYWDQSIDEEESPSGDDHKSSTRLVREPVNILTKLDDKEEPVTELPTSGHGSHQNTSLITTSSNGTVHKDRDNGVPYTMKKYRAGGMYGPCGPGSFHHAYDGNDVNDVIDGGASTLRRETSVSSNILTPGNGFHEVRKPKKYDDEEDSVYDDDTYSFAKDHKPFMTLCEKATKLLDEISTHVHNTVLEGSMTQEELNDLVETMQETVTDLESTKCILKM